MRLLTGRLSEEGNEPRKSGDDDMVDGLREEDSGAKMIPSAPLWFMLGEVDEEEDEGGGAFPGLR